MGNQLLRHGFCQFRINNGDIRGDFEVSDRVFDAFAVVGDDRESGHFGSSAGSGGNCAKLSLFAEFGNTKNLAHIFKGAVRIFIFDPHCLRGIDRGTAANGNDPVRLEFLHRSCTAHYGFDRRIGFNTVKNLHFHAGFLQISFSAVKKAETLHGAAADTNHRLVAFEGL